MSAADRNAGPNDGRIAGQARQISRWMRNAKFDRDPDRAISHLMENPDKWIDPTLSPSVNYQRVKSDFGLRTQTEITKRARDADDQARDSARRKIRENIDRIDAGHADDLLADIEAEYGAEYVAEFIDAARTDRDGEGRPGAPEPNAVNPSAVAHANGRQITNTPANTVATPPAPESTIRFLARLPDPVQTLCIVIYLLVRYPPVDTDSSGVGHA